jgi:hypothetical protein
MRNLTKLGLLLSFGLIATGCIVAPSPAPAPQPAPAPSPGPAPAPAPTPQLDAPRPLGLQSMLGYRVAAGASAELPAGDIGFVVTANGQGGYRLTWSDTYGSAANFQGLITTDGQFDPSQVRGYSGAEALTIGADYRSISFSSTPGAAVDGVDLVSSTDPIYFDLYVDGARTGFSIYFTGAETGTLVSSAYNPVAFTSP